jgi:hypothetical protein
MGAVRFMAFSFRHHKFTAIFYALSVIIFYYLSCLQQDTATGHTAISFVCYSSSVLVTTMNRGLLFFVCHI